MPDTCGYVRPDELPPLAMVPDNSRVHIDTAPLGADFTGGRLYLFDNNVSRAPALHCPQCGTNMLGIDDARRLYTCPGGVCLPPIFEYRLSPCGHLVNAIWAGQLRQELQRRQQLAYTPQSILDVVRVAQVSYLQELAHEYAELRKAFAEQTNPALVLEYRLVQLADQMFRVGGSRWLNEHAQGLPRELCREVLTWAVAAHYWLPPTMRSRYADRSTHRVDAEVPEPGDAVVRPDDYGARYPMPDFGSDRGPRHLSREQPQQGGRAAPDPTATVSAEQPQPAQDIPPGLESEAERHRYEFHQSMQRRRRRILPLSDKP